MATDFLGRTLNIGDDVFFLNYNGTSANLERGKITKVFPHTAEIGKKRRAEYKIVKILTDVAPVVRCKGCKHKGWVQEPCHGKSVDYENAAHEVINANHEAIGNKALAFVGTSGVQLGWLASQADMLADDWVIVWEAVAE